MKINSIDTKIQILISCSKDIFRCLYFKTIRLELLVSFSNLEGAKAINDNRCMFPSPVRLIFLRLCLIFLAKIHSIPKYLMKYEINLIVMFNL